MPDRTHRRFRLPWRSRGALSRDLDDELALHLDARVADLVAAGVDPDTARRQAIEEFGDIDFTRRYCRDLDRRTEREARLSDVLSAWRQDTRFAWRSLRHNPGFASVTVLTLALAIGANTAVFSVARAVLLRPLPFADPGALVGLYSTPVDHPESHWDLSAPDLADYRARLHTLAGIDDATAASAETAILSYGFWRRAMGGDPAAVGRTITLYDKPYTVIGIMPRGFTITGREDLWLPLDLSGDLANADVTRKQHVYRAIAPLESGVSVEAARADAHAIARSLQQEYPVADAQYLATIVPLHESLTARVQEPLLLLLAAALLVLLIACANLANLTLARTLNRTGEIAVRAALGAGRGRLARQSFTESLICRRWVKAQGRGTTGGRAGARLRRTLVVAQVALAVILLVGAGLLTRSFRELARVPLGFDPDHVTAQVRLDGDRYDSESALNQFLDGVLGDIAAAPGVVSAGAVMGLPTQGGPNSGISVEGVPGDPENLPSIGYSMVRGDYFEATKIPIVAGRAFNATATPDGPKTAVVNQAAAPSSPEGTRWGAVYTSDRTRIPDSRPVLRLRASALRPPPDGPSRLWRHRKTGGGACARRRRTRRGRSEPCRRLAVLVRTVRTGGANLRRTGRSATPPWGAHE